MLIYSMRKNLMASKPRDSNPNIDVKHNINHFMAYVSSYHKYKNTLRWNYDDIPLNDILQGYFDEESSNYEYIFRFRPIFCRRGKVIEYTKNCIKNGYLYIYVRPIININFFPDIDRNVALKISRIPRHFKVYRYRVSFD